MRETDFRPEAQAVCEGARPSIQDIYRALAGDEARNRMILDDVVLAIAEGRSPLLLTERKDHRERLAHELRERVRNVIVLRGGLTPKVRARIEREIAAIPSSAERLIVATGRYVGEGFDDARLDTLFLAMPVSWKGTVVQYAGRLQRTYSKKTEVRIVDYVDRHVEVLERMFAKRFRVYRAFGFRGASSSDVVAGAGEVGP